MIQEVSSRTVLVFILVVLTITSLGAVGATIGSTTGTELSEQPGGGSREIGGGTDGPELEIGGVDSDGVEQGQRRTIDLSICIVFLTKPVAILGIILAVAGVMYASYRRYNSSGALLIGTGVVPAVWLVYFLLTNCGSTGSGGGGGLFSSSALVSGEGGVSSFSVPPVAAVAVLTALIVTGAVLVFRSAGVEESVVSPEDEMAPEAETSDLAAAAGRAADRIERTNQSVDNTVYQAWVEMTGLLDIDNPDATSPRGFAREAIKAGLSEPDVKELTELFNEVRYGHKTPTEYEDRALETLRNIETTYTETRDPVEPDMTGSDSA